MLWDYRCPFQSRRHSFLQALIENVITLLSRQGPLIAFALFTFWSVFSTFYVSSDMLHPSCGTLYGHPQGRFFQIISLLIMGSGPGMKAICLPRDDVTSLEGSHHVGGLDLLPLPVSMFLLRDGIFLVRPIQRRMPRAALERVHTSASLTPDLSESLTPFAAEPFVERIAVLGISRITGFNQRALHTDFGALPSVEN